MGNALKEEDKNFYQSYCISQLVFSASDIWPPDMGIAIFFRTIVY